MNRQRALVMAALTVEREQAVDGIIQAFAAERLELLRYVESQRLATLEWATAERREATAEVRLEPAASIDALRGERAVVVDDLRHIVDLVLLRVAIFLVAAVLLAPSSLTSTPVSGRGDGASHRHDCANWDNRSARARSAAVGSTCVDQFTLLLTEVAPAGPAAAPGLPSGCRSNFAAPITASAAGRPLATPAPGCC